MFASIFLEFTLPNAATWFYFSFLLCQTVFFKFDRLLSLRNWDLVSLYLLVPGLLFVQEAHAQIGRLPAEHRTIASRPVLAEAEQLPGEIDQVRQRSRDLLLAGYIWLLIGTGYLFARCLFDLGLERRPAVSPNLNLPGLVWLGAALCVCLIAVTIRRIPDAPQEVGRGPVALSKVKDGATAVVEGSTGGDRHAGLGVPYWVERAVLIILHLAVVTGLVLIGWTHFRDPVAGVGMAGLYLMLPYTAYHVAQLHHVWPAAFILWAVYSYRRPGVAGGVLGVAAGTAFFPSLLFPLWLGFYRGRGAGRFVLGFLVASGLSLAFTAALLIGSGELRESLVGTLSLSEWQPWKAPHTEGLWQGTHWAYRLPVFIAYMAFIILTMFWPSPRNLAQVIAQSAAVVIGVQFWYADQGGVYILWYLPLVLLVVFRPNLADVRPPQPLPASGLVYRAGQFVSWARRFGRSARPAGMSA